MNREAFEKWLNHPKACERRLSVDSINRGDYVREDVQMQWEAWQAAQAEMQATILEQLQTCDPSDGMMLDWLSERCFSPGDHPDDGILVVVSSEFSPWGEFAIGKEKEALRRAIKRAMIAGA